MPVDEFFRWLAFCSIEPIGEAREDFRMAFLSSVIANSQRGKGSAIAHPKDFMPEWWDRPEDDPRQAGIALGKRLSGIAKKKK